MVAAIAVADSLGALARYGLEGFGADSHLKRRASCGSRRICPS